jgi:hypothetical protein
MDKDTAADEAGGDCIVDYHLELDGELPSSSRLL